MCICLHIHIHIHIKENFSQSTTVDWRFTCLSSAPISGQKRYVAWCPFPFWLPSAVESMSQLSTHTHPRTLLPSAIGTRHPSHHLAWLIWLLLGWDQVLTMNTDHTQRPLLGPFTSVKPSNFQQGAQMRSRRLPNATTWPQWSEFTHSTNMFLPRCHEACPQSSFFF